MGVACLWKALERHGMLEKMEPGAVPQAELEALCGTSVAIDLSPWIFEATTQGTLLELFPPEMCVVKARPDNAPKLRACAPSDVNKRCQAGSLLLCT